MKGEDLYLLPPAQSRLASFLHTDIFRLTSPIRPAKSENKSETAKFKEHELTNAML